MADILAEVYAIDAANKARHVVDVILNFMDDLLLAGNFAECDLVFANADTERLSSQSIVTLLGVTLAAKQLLPSRARFFDKAMERIQGIKGSEAGRRLLDKYK